MHKLPRNSYEEELSRMYTKTKQMIFDYLVEETGNLQERNLNVYTANYICEKFIISRSLASHYLNELFKEIR